MIGRRHLTFTGDNIYCKVLHRRIEDFLYTSVKAVNFVNKKHITLVKVCKDCRQVSRLFDCRAGCNADVHTKLICNYLGKCGFAQSGRAVEKHMVKWLLPLNCRLDIHLQIFLNLFLSDIVLKGFWTKGIVAVHCKVILGNFVGVNYSVFVIQFKIILIIHFIFLTF